MPDFDTRRPQEQNVPNEPGIGMVAHKLRSALMATRLRALLMGGGILLFVVALPVGLLIYSPSWLGAQDQGSSQREVGSSQQTSDETADMALVSPCADKGSTVGQQEEVGNLLEMLAGLLAEAGVQGPGEVSRGEVSNGKIAFLRRNADGYTDIYVIDGEGTHETRLTATKWTEDAPTWSPDGEKIAFSRSKADNYTDIYVMDADGANQTRLTGSAESLGNPVWSPDGRKIAFVTRGLQSNGLSVLNADGTNRSQLQTELFTLSGETTLSLGSPVWSPSGNKLAFGSYTIPGTIGAPADSTASPPAPVEGLTGIYLVNVDGTGLCKLTSTHKLTDPAWSPTERR